MLEEAPDELGGLPASHIEPNQAISRMSPIGPVKIAIQAAERGLGQAVKHWKQVLIVGPPGGHVDADHPEANAPVTQQLPLVGGQIFVQQQHGTPETARV
jgi:hypothetical protein